MSTSYCRRRVFELAAALALSLGWALGAGATELRLNLGHAYPVGTLQAQMADRFAATIERSTGGSVRITVHPAGSFAPEFQLAKLVAAGVGDLALVGGSLATFAHSFRLFDLPYLVHDRRHMTTLFQDLVAPDLAPQARDLGIEVLAVVDGGFRHIAAKKPIDGLKDLGGLRIRTVGSAAVTGFFENLGARPVLLPLPEVYAAAKADVINAADLPLNAMLAIRIDEVLPYVWLSKHLYTPVYLVASTRLMGRLDGRSRSALQAAAREVMAASFQQGESDERRDLEGLRGRTKVLDPSEYERRVLIDISRKSYDRFASELKGSSDLISRALKLSPRS
jgi:TRAP-type C4-dicarboxylate transport system substrate-binding protein